MKRSLPWVLASILFVLAACAQQTLSDEQAYKRFVGTWENPEPQLSQPYVKVVLQPDHIMKFWVRKDSQSTSAQTVAVKKTWVDAEGGTCCQFFWVVFEASIGRGVKGLGLMRLDKARKILELNTKLGNEDDVYPDQFERRSLGENWTRYMIFYRK